MSRLVRLLVPGLTNHVIQRGNNRQAIFFADEDRSRYLGWLGQALDVTGCRLHAYVLMTNHVHLLLTGAHADSVPRLMQSLGRHYVGDLNRRYGRTGTLWEGRYKSTILDSERYVLACYRYIEANPVRARMVARPDDHPWSSWHANGLGRADPLLSAHETYRALGATPEARCDAYRALFAEGLNAEMLATLRDATQRGWVPGSERFRSEIEAVLGRRAGPPVRGRPAGAKDRRERRRAGSPAGSSPFHK
jgi:putative transposase